ncbi:MAG: hypothetical protein IJ086_15800 [Clostridium sp.]|nr:hypothetical protein [Clostridium sp.]MBQ9000138.1 hypothetical protein [Clostridium sp.]
MSTFKKKYLYALIAMIFFAFSVFSKNVYADEINFAVSPSKVVDMVIEPGTAQSIKFKVGNRSVFPSHQTEKNDLYEISVAVEAAMTTHDGDVVDTNGIIKISDTLLKAKPNQSAAETTVEIKIPSNFEKNSYRIDIIFTRYPIKGIEDVSSTSAITSIKVPIYMGVGTPEEYANLKTDYEILDLNIDLGEESTVFKYALSNLKDLITLNPFKVINVFSSIDEKDTYVVNKNGKTSVDVLSGMYTEMRNVVSYTNKLTKNKYVKITQEDENKEVSNVYFEEGAVNFKLTDGTSIILECHNRVRDNIRAQINTLIREHNLTKPRFRFFLDNLSVPTNKNFNILEYKANMKIKNTGEKENFVSANISLKKDSVYNVGNQTVELLTLMKGETIDVSMPLNMTSEVTNGSYSLSAEFTDTKNNVKSKVFNFTVDLSIDKKVFWTTLVLYVVILAVIAVIIVLIIKNLRDKKGRIGYIQAPYSPIGMTQENFELYKDMYNLVIMDDLSRIYTINNNDTIVRSDASITDSKQIHILMAMDVVEVLDSNIISSNGDNTIWTKIRFKK